MERDPDRILTESIKRLLRRNAVSSHREIVNKSRGADLSAVFRSVFFYFQIATTFLGI